MQFFRKFLKVNILANATNNPKPITTASGYVCFNTSLLLDNSVAVNVNPSIVPKGTRNKTTPITATPLK